MQATGITSLAMLSVPSCRMRDGSCSVTSPDRADARRPPRATDAADHAAARYVRVLVWCRSCRRRRDADLQALVNAGRGDVPLIHLRFRCSNCGSQLTDFVVTSRDEPRPW
jgi:hypothetical protein